VWCCASWYGPVRTLLIPVAASTLTVFHFIQQRLLGDPKRAAGASTDEEFMGNLRSIMPWLGMGLIAVLTFSGCGGHRPPGVSPFAGKVILIPSQNASLQQGSVIFFTASAQNGSGQNIGGTFTFTSSDTSILNIAPNGAACGGHWNATFSICTPGATGLALVTASASSSSVTSATTLVYVHPPIDNITVTGILLNGLLIQEPCLSQSQTMTVEAHAFSQGVDITSSVGPFIWTANNASVAKITPLLNLVYYQGVAYNVATNQATATATTPGITQIYAEASGIFSTSFQQPPPGTNLNFFETCPIQSIKLELGQVGSGQTSFEVTKGGTTLTQTIVATVTDVMGNSSLPNTDGAIVLSKIPLTWISSQSGAILPGSNCTLSCTVTLPSTGAAAITASCSPPTCNIGFPLFPTVQFPPQPVYPATPVSGLVVGSTASASMLASSLGCEYQPPSVCTTVFYNVATTKAQAGNPSGAPSSPNSLMFDLAGDKAYMGSAFGALAVAPGSVGGSSSPFSLLSSVTGQVVAVSPKGDMAVFSDTLHSPNQVYIPISAGQSLNVVALNINGASAAGFSPDELKAFIFGLDNNNNPNLYVYSGLQSLQVIPLAAGTVVNAVAFSNNGAFAYVAESSPSTGAANLTLFDICNNQVAATVALPAAAMVMKVLPSPLLNGLDTSGYLIPNGEHVLILDATGIDILTIQPTGTGCPLTASFISGAPPPALVQRIQFEQGTVDALNFFVSPDSSTVYVPASNQNSILTYYFPSGAWVGGIQLLNNAAPAAPVAGAPTVGATIDTGYILVAGNDGLLHQVTTGLNGSDLIPFQFPNLPDILNPFCIEGGLTAGPCSFNLLVVKP